MHVQCYELSRVSSDFCEGNLLVPTLTDWKRASSIGLGRVAKNIREIEAMPSAKST